MFSTRVKFLSAALITGCTALQTIDDPNDLHKSFDKIFPSGSRNAASHRWATHVIERSEEMTDETFRKMFSYFCAVSGSPVNPGPAKRWQMTLPQVADGPDLTGVTYFCCSPCVCDTYEFIKIDTKTITTLDGPKQYHFMVIGNPCLHPEKLRERFEDPFTGEETSLQCKAPSVTCSGSNLQKSTLSDNGHIILSMFIQDDPWPGYNYNDASERKEYCNTRAETGFKSGMGQIFRKVALISPLGNLTVGGDSSTAEVASTMTIDECPANGGNTARNPSVFQIFFTAILVTKGIENCL